MPRRFATAINGSLSGPIAAEIRCNRVGAAADVVLDAGVGSVAGVEGRQLLARGVGGVGR